MYEYCLTYLYSVLLALGGFIGLASEGWNGSFGGSVGSGAVHNLPAHTSLLCYVPGSNEREEETLLSLVVSTALTVFMASRNQGNGYVFPAGVFAILCGAMSLFCVRPFFMGPRPK